MLGNKISKILPQIGRSGSPDSAVGQGLHSSPRSSDELGSSLDEARIALMSRGQSAADIMLGLDFVFLYI